MKTLFTAVTAGCAAVLLSTNPAYAEHHEAGPNATPVEMFTCSYNKGKGPRDLAKVNAKWNAWSDANDPKGYSAWNLTPQFYNEDITWDVAWLGAWSNFAEMGSSTDTWLSKGMQGDYDKILSCGNHTGAASVAIKESTAPQQPTSVVLFSSCTVAEGKKVEEAFDAHVKFADWMAGKGSTAGIWAFFPGLGAGAMKFHYYMVIGYNNYSEMAKTGEIINNGGGWMKRRELMQGVVSCDVPRVYDARLVRSDS